MGISAGIREPGIAALAKKYADKLIAENFETAWPSGANPENIGSGASGVALFLLELYMQTRDEKYRQAASNLIDDILVWCKEHPTHNYGLYAGRSGVVYLLMHYYRLTGDEVMIKECLELIVPANKEFLHSKYTNDYLYEGRAGTLLLMLHLFLISGEECLLPYIHEFSQKIIGNAQLYGEGLFWNAEEEFHLRPPCGFAHGTFGLQYVLARLNQVFPNPALSFVLEGLERYHGSCWVEEFRSWGDFSKPLRNKEALTAYKTAYLHSDPQLFAPKEDYGWANGTTGILFSRLIKKNGRTLKLGKEVYKKVAGEHSGSRHLYDGLAGLGLYFLEITTHTGNSEWREILSQLTDGLPVSPAGFNTRGGLFHSDLGCLYFLLKAGGHQGSGENILVPFLHEGRIPAGDAGEKFSMDIKTVVKGLLAKHYPRTVYLLETIAPGFFKSYLPAGMRPGDKDELSNFAFCMTTSASDYVSPAVHERLMDLFYFEKEQLAFLLTDERTSFQIYLDSLFHQEEVMEYLNRPDEWLMQQSAAISGTVKFLQSRWNWSFVDDFERMEHKKVRARFLGNLNSPPGSFEYMIQVSDKLKCSEVLLQIESMPGINSFEGFKPVSSFVAEIRDLLLSLPENALRDILTDIGAMRILASRDFLKLMDRVILRQIRSAMLKNILMIKSSL